MLYYRLKRKHLFTKSKLSVIGLHRDEAFKRRMLIHSLSEFSVKGRRINYHLRVNLLHKALDNVDIKLSVKRNSYSSRRKNRKIGRKPLNTRFSKNSHSLFGISHSRKSRGYSEYHSVKFTVGYILNSSALSEIAEGNPASVLLKNTAKIAYVGNPLVLSSRFLFIIYLRLLVARSRLFISCHN